MNAPRLFAALVLLTGCVDAPIRLFEIDADRPARPEAGPDDDPDASAIPTDADPLPDHDNGRFDAGPDAAPLDAAPDLDLPDLTLPDLDLPDLDLPDQGPGPLECPAGCAVADTLAAYLPVERVDAVARLPDGQIVIGGAASLAALRAFAGPLGADEIAGPVFPADGAHATRPFIARLSADLSVLHGVEYLRVEAGAVDAIRPLASRGELRLYVSGQYGPTLPVDAPLFDRIGYYLAELTLSGDGLTSRATSVVSAGGGNQTSPTWAPRPDGVVFQVNGHPFGREWSAGIYARVGELPVPVAGWRHHQRIDGLTNPVFVGQGPVGAFGFLPFIGPDFCPQRSWDDAAFGERPDDGRGGQNLGRYPFDGFGSGPCATTGVATVAPALPDVGPHGWRIDNSLTFEAADAVIDPNGDALYLALNATALRGDAVPVNGEHPAGATDRVPTVLRQDRDGRLVWWRRLHRQQLADGTPVPSLAAQRVLALALDPRPPGALVVLAETTIGDVHPLWPAPADGAAGFQRPPPAVVGAAEQPVVGWLGRFALDGTLLAATYVFDPRRDDPDDRRPGRLGCWTDTDRAADPQPVPLRLERHALAIGPAGEVAIRARAARALTTPDAWLPAPPTAEAPGAEMELVRVFDADLSTVLYSTVIEEAIERPMPERDVIVQDIAFDAFGRLLVVGRQIAPAGAGRLPTLAVPQWGRAEPVSDLIDPPSSAFLLRLARDPACGAVPTP
ncbi:MAG: hypothetical protein H6701_02430 [Myxococcales bacterium]|nr:hypothetical protein [Myxococcales bacterium]